MLFLCHIQPPTVAPSPAYLSCLLPAQPKHYNEPGVGVALAKLCNEGVVKREDLFLQVRTGSSIIGGKAVAHHREGFFCADEQG